MTATGTELTGKAKKAKRDEERRKAGKKRKRHQETQALPEVDEPEADEERTLAAEVEVARKESKKRKSDANEPETTLQADGAASEPPSKRRRKAKSADNNKPDEPAPKKQRFIVFVGNLPYTITTAGITEHFSKIKPESVRHMTEPGSTKSKGYAFLEFKDFDRMKTCLSLYHHTTIDSGVGGAKGIKKINVELTAGGGGNSGNRQNKLKERNARLREQRKRKAEAVAKAEQRKGAKGARHGKSEVKPQKSKALDAPDANANGGGDQGIHPARLARINAE